MTPLEQIVGIGALVTMATGAALFVAPKSDIDKVEQKIEEVDQRVTQLINSDMAKAALQRMWLLEARYGGQVCCAGWNATDIALWKDAKAEYDNAVTKKKKDGG